jgi:hypothetical protein
VTNGATSVGHVVDEDGDAVLDVAHQHHRGHLVGLAPLLVDQRKLHVQSIGYRGHSRGTNRGLLKLNRTSYI